MEFHVIDHPSLTKTMSKHAKNLREEVFKFCLLQVAGGRPRSVHDEFCAQVVAGYNPIVWERAILYAHPSEVYDAVLRATSTNGHVKGGRKKDTDWLKIATEFDYNLWMNRVRPDAKRSASRIDPSDFDKLAPQFTKMYVLLCDWLLADFGYSVLFNIFDMTRRYSTSIIKECIEKVDDPNHRSIDYLLAIVDKELAIRREEMLRDKELSDSSKQIIDAVTSIAINRTQPINWDEIDHKIDIDVANQAEFDKVKT